MSVATDEDVFTFLTEDFDIACEIGVELCPGESAKYIAAKKCCGFVLLIGEFCKNYLLETEVGLFNYCTECGAVCYTKMRASDLFIITPL